jgi:alpha-1,6-mannosyltransferase
LAKANNRTFYLLLGVYVVLIALSAVTSYSYPQYRFSGSGLIFLVGIGGSLTALCGRGRIIRRRDWIVAGVIACLALLSFPSTSRDYLRYLFDGEMIRLWHISPYIHLPGQFAPDQYSRLFAGYWWTSIPSPYGPLWQALMASINAVSGNQLIPGIIALKLVNLIGLGLSARYIYLISGRAWMSWAFAINPVIILNTLATPHADILLAAAVLAAWHYRMDRRSGILLGAAALIKPYTFLFMPFERRSVGVWRVFAWGVVTSVLMLTALRPLVHFEFTSMIRASLGGSLSITDSLFMHSLFPTASIQQLSVLSVALFTALYIVLLVSFWRGYICGLSATALASLLVPVCLTGLLLPWHFIISIALLSVLDHRFARWTLLFLTITVLRSAVTVTELLGLAALFCACGWTIHRLAASMAAPPKYLTRFIELLS